MAIEFKYNDSVYRLALKYGWFHTNEKLKATRGRELCRAAMTNAIINDSSKQKGDLHFYATGVDNHEPYKFNWRMCAVFITKINGEKRESNIEFGPSTSVCVPGDQFTYTEARKRAIGILKDQAINIYAQFKRQSQSTNLNGQCHLFNIAIQAFLAWTKRKHK